MTSEFFLVFCSFVPLHDDKKTKKKKEKARAAAHAPVGRNPALFHKFVKQRGTRAIYRTEKSHKKGLRSKPQKKRLPQVTRLEIM